MAVVEDGFAVQESREQLQEFMNNERFIHYIGMIFPPRPGVAECISLVEHRHFKPRTPRNELFIMRLIEWSDINWVIMSIPIEDKALVENIANECGLRIVKGAPAMLDANGVQTFPVNNDRVFTFENKAGHPIYRNDPAINKVIFDAENETLRRIH